MRRLLLLAAAVAIALAVALLWPGHAPGPGGAADAGAQAANPPVERPSVASHAEPGDDGRVPIILQPPGARGAAEPASPARRPAVAVRPVDAARPTRDAPRAGGLKTTLDGVEVLDFGRPVLRGRVDLSATIARILAGQPHPHRNDGAVFANREGRLPRQPRGYYREYVHPTPGVRGAGPQRVVVGRGGDWYYSPDHYGTFLPLGARPEP